ncbi:hypothetical protein QCA50_008171 [Cerrena zonata]|uniref:Uncharacterized protein n=1 Tax=Cerrena zonata TaxID=2478898 RepID=A0AAW0G5R1_9APHY
MDNYDIQQCQTQNDWAFTYDTGLYLEGISVFANTTNDSALTQLADQIALDSMKKSSLWTNVNGVITESRSNEWKDDIGHSFKAMLIRALHEHWSRSEKTSEIAILIEKFLTVQHNAILNLARYPGTNLYTYTWVGPPAPTMLPSGQLAAMDVLSSSISFAANTTDTNNTSSNISPSPTSQQQSSTSRKTSFGAIGGAVGGSLALILVIGILFMHLHNRRSAALTKALFHGPEPLGEYAGRVSSQLLQYINPFPPPSPPPFPIIEHFHSSKVQNADRQPSSAASRSNSQPSSSPGVACLSTSPHTRPAENSGTRQDSTTEMMNHQALASLAEESLPATAPPRYEDI